MSRILLTAHGAERLRKELKNLKSIDRPRVIAAIAEARSHGDLSENAEYDAAKEQQGFIEGRISELESQLSRAEIFNPAEHNADGKVIFGSWVELYDEGNDAEVRYQIVGDLEADLNRGQISLSSPIARALIGKKAGDEVEVKTPGGIRSYEILDISYE
jgi:transcription elongation factor GreA